MEKTLSICKKVFFYLIRKNFVNCCALTLLCSLSSCGKGISEEGSSDDDGKDTQYLLSKEINLSKAKNSYQFPGGADLNLPEFIEYKSGDSTTSAKLTFSKGIQYQEVDCYYDFEATTSDHPARYRLDECYRTASPGNSLRYLAGQSIYQDKDSIMELESFDANVQAQIEVVWFSK